MDRGLGCTVQIEVVSRVHININTYGLVVLATNQSRLKEGQSVTRSLLSWVSYLPTLTRRPLFASVNVQQLASEDILGCLYPHHYRYHLESQPQGLCSILEHRVRRSCQPLVCLLE